MNLLIATDIFGQSLHTDELRQQLAHTRNEVTVIDPYFGQRYNFIDEAAAYQHFSETLSIDEYAQELATHIANSNQPVTVLGFSAGATAAWAVAAQLTENTLIKMIGFYGSQIRYLDKLTPNCPCQLVFPKLEQHFNLQPLITNLQTKENVLCTSTPYLHGFMNPLSSNFNQAGYEKYLTWLNQTLSNSN